MLKVDSGVVTDRLTFKTRVDALAGTWGEWGRIGSRLREPHWTTPTRCPGWEVAAVYAHVSMFPVALDRGLAPPADDPQDEPLTAVDILRGFNKPKGIAHKMAGAVAEAAVIDASETGREELVARFVAQGCRVINVLHATDPSTRVSWPASGAVITLAEGLRIVLMESTVHLLDVQRALGLDPETIPPTALAETTGLLAEIAPAIAFIEAATGRCRSADSPLPVVR